MRFKLEQLLHHGDDRVGARNQSGATALNRPRATPHESPEPQKTAVDQMDCSQACGQTKRLSGQSGDSARAAHRSD